MKASSLIKFTDKSWKNISQEYQNLVRETNRHLSDDKSGDKGLAIEYLYELVWGTVEYLKAEAEKILDENNKMMKDHPTIKSYLNQLLNLMSTIEEICFIHSSLAADRYVLYYKEIVGTLEYLGLNPLPLIIDFILELQNTSNLKYSSNLYIGEFCSFITEMAIFGYETSSIVASQTLLEESTKFIDKVGKYEAFDIIKLHVTLGIIYENHREFKKAALAYKETFKTIKAMQNQAIDPYVLHEIGIFGYINAFLSQDKDEDLLEDFFEFRSIYFSPEEASYIGELHSTYFLGITDVSRIPYLGNRFDNYRSSLRSFVMSGSANRLYHFSSVSYLSDLTRIIRQSVERPYAIVVFESETYKDIDIHVGKEPLPAKQILKNEDGESGTIDVLGRKIQVSNPFCWAGVFRKNSEAIIKVGRKTYRRKLEYNEIPPTIIVINISKEVEETSLIKTGKAIKYYDQLWVKEMSILDIMRNISNIPSDLFFFEEMEEFGGIFKKIDNKEVSNLIKNLTGKDAIPLDGQALQLVLLQRLSELTDDSEEALRILSSLVKK